MGITAHTIMKSIAAPDSLEHYLLKFILLLITATCARQTPTTAIIIPNVNIIYSFLCFFKIIILYLFYLSAYSLSTFSLLSLAAYLQVLIPRLMPTKAITANATTAAVIIPNVIIIFFLS